MRLLLVLVIVSVVLGAAVGVATGRMEFAGYEERFEVRPPQLKVNPREPSLAFPTDGTPVAVIEGSDSFDFGSMRVDTSERHAFVVRNAGDAPLTIKPGDTSCKCTVSGVEKNSVEPGETAEIELKWTPKATAPDFQQTATIHTNDPVRPELTLKVSGAVLTDAWLDPADFSLPDQNPSEPRTIESFVLSPNKGSLLVQTKFDNERLIPFMSIAQTPATPEELAARRGANSGVKLSITLERGFPLGPFQQNVIVTTNASAAPVTLPIHGHFTGDLKILGESFDAERSFLDLGTIPSAEGREAKLTLLIKGERASEIDVTFSPEESDPAEAFEVEFGEKRQVGAAGAVMIPFTLRVKPGLPTMNRIGSETDRAGKALLKTTHPDYPTLPIWVRFAVATDGS